MLKIFRNPRKLEDYDQAILLVVIALTCLGVVMVYSASAVMADKRYHDGFYFLKRQGGFALIGTAIMLITMQIDYHVWRSWTWQLLGLSLLLLVAVLVPGLGGNAGGSSRWLRLVPGLRFQPSEMVKIAFIIYMAFAIERKQDKIKTFGRGFISYMFVLLALLILLLCQPDFGSAVTLFLVAIAMLFAAGTRKTYIISIFLLSLPFFYLLVMKVAYRRRRIMAFLDPWQDPQNTGYQIIQSLMGLGLGGLFGKGLVLRPA